MKKTIVLFSALWMMVTLTANAQNAVVPAGGTATGNGGTVTYTTGQIAVQNNNDGNHSISEGVQQPYEISVVGIDEYPDIVLNASLYPNPTLGNIQLTMDKAPEKGRVRIYDTNGKYLIEKKIAGETTSLDLSPYAPGTYFVNVYNDQQQLKCFKVVKTGR